MLFKKLGINSEQTKAYSDEAHEAALLEEIQAKDVTENPTDQMFYDATQSDASSKKQVSTV
jgi:biotin synthase